MKKIILGVAVSLDGMIEGPNGDYSWCPPPAPKEMNDFLDKVDTIFLGRKCFELMGASSFKGKDHYVFSTTLKQANGAQIIGENVREKILEIKKQPGKDIWLFGGAKLVTYFMNETLVDELWLGLVPVVLGEGKLLFSDIRQRSNFILTEARPKNGYVSLSYKAEPKKSDTN